MQEVIDRLDALADAFEGLAANITPPKPQKPWVGVLASLIAHLVAGGAIFAGCMSYQSNLKAEMRAELRELRRIIAMQKEDPKNFKRIDDQFKAIKEYEDGTNNRRTPD